MGWDVSRQSEGSSPARGRPPEATPKQEEEVVQANRGNDWWDQFHTGEQMGGGFTECFHLIPVLPCRQFTVHSARSCSLSTKPGWKISRSELEPEYEVEPGSRPVLHFAPPKKKRRHAADINSTNL